MIDRQTPVIVGVGQVNGAPEAEEPIDLIAQAVEDAIKDSGTRTVPIDLIALTKIGTKQYTNAPQRLGERTGFPNARTLQACLLYTSPSPRDGLLSRMPSSA